MLDYKLIEALAMVIEEGGFDKASKKLNITQSAVSQRVRMLEENTGRILLTRSTPPAMTPAGTQFLKHYLQVKRLEGDLDAAIASDVAPEHESLAIGLNADSLETWFLKAVSPFLKHNHITLDLRVDDQDETHKMLKNGEVAGCISARKIPVQGCTSTCIGTMTYRLTATPEFIHRFFPQGLTPDAVCHAPAVIFNRKDKLHASILEKIFGKQLHGLPAHYVPSTEKFADFITNSHAYGVIPEEQCKSLLANGDLIDLAPDHAVAVKLYWHCWNIKSTLLNEFGAALEKGFTSTSVP